MAFPAYTMLIAYRPSPSIPTRRTQFDDGFIDQQRRTGTTHYIVDCTLIMTNIEYQNFIAWFQSTPDEWFQFFDPNSQTNKTHRLLDLSYKAEPLKNASHWRVSLKMERFE